LRVKGKSDLLGLVRRVWGVPRTETLPMRLPGPGERAVRLPFPLADRVGNQRLWPPGRFYGILSILPKFLDNPGGLH
jgi:hypothetical protein